MKMGKDGYSGMKMSKDKYSGMKMYKDMGGVFNLKDNTHASAVKSVSTNSEQYDMGRVQYESVGSKGYPAEAWKYEY